MSFYGDLARSRCYPPCEGTCQQPAAHVCTDEPCITSCGDSRAVVNPPPVSVILPGPILSTFPQDTIVGSTLPALPYGAGGSFGGGVWLWWCIWECIWGWFSGYGRRYGRSYSSRFGSCGPC
uniref:Keratin n=1 Tax=Gopherus agassizii TaxID=38772 RepID=A0A452HCE3_9SAUR